MNYSTAERMLEETGYTDEERRLARLRIRQRQLFPGDGKLLEPRPLMATVEEVLRWRQTGRSA